MADRPVPIKVCWKEKDSGNYEQNCRANDLVRGEIAKVALDSKDWLFTRARRKRR